jgi:FkbM family methyltransferase
MSLFGAFWDKDPNPVGNGQFGNNKGLFYNLNWYPKGVLHIGAWDAWEAKQYAHYCGGNSVFIEANPNSFERFRKEIEQFGQKIYNYAAWNEDDQEMNLYCPPGREDTSSLIEQSGHAIKVQTIRMDTLFDREGLSFDNFDLLNVDTEGVELQVLHGIGENIKKFTYIIVEVSDIGSVSDINVNQYLLDMGFEFVRDSEHHLSGINNKWFCDKLYKSQNS